MLLCYPWDDGWRSKRAPVAFSIMSKCLLEWDDPNTLGCSHFWVIILSFLGITYICHNYLFNQQNAINVKLWNTFRLPSLLGAAFFHLLCPCQPFLLIFCLFLPLLAGVGNSIFQAVWIPYWTWEQNEFYYLLGKLKSFRTKSFNHNDSCTLTPLIVQNLAG